MQFAHLALQGSVIQRRHNLFAAAGGRQHPWATSRRHVKSWFGRASDLIEIGEGRTRFFALWGLLTGLGFLLAVLFDAIALWSCRYAHERDGLGEDHGAILRSSPAGSR